MHEVVARLQARDMSHLAQFTDVYAHNVAEETPTQTWPASPIASYTPDTAQMVRLWLERNGAAIGDGFAVASLWLTFEP